MSYLSERLLQILTVADSDDMDEAFALVLELAAERSARARRKTKVHQHAQAGWLEREARLLRLAAAVIQSQHPDVDDEPAGLDPLDLVENY